jgi:hypothetical protein
VKGRTSVLRRRAWAHFLMYVADMALAISAFIFGFGLEVHNWWALLLIGSVGRFSFHMAASALMYATERERVREDDEAAA